MKIKRYFDIVFASIGLTIFCLPALLIMLLIVIEDQGPIFFRQERLGKNRNYFKLLKFRSMNQNGVTRIGKWLRDTGLDEIPQFVNVLKGDMSMVGPRPLTEEDVKRLGWHDARYDNRWHLAPGVTGLAQLFADESERKSYYLFDRAYLRYQSLRLDIWIILLSFAVNLFGKKRIRKFLSGK
jgi:lipopolysaccharide/colanic/teichoic acid biosynthesis glycosyltransferase